MSAGNDKRKDLMREIRDEVINLHDSPLYSYRIENGYYPVIGEGSHQSKIMFIGEGPGLNEAKTGRPFCGAAGRVLDELLVGAGIKREDVYITNIIKDRPPKNRDPEPSEVKIYGPFLDRQVDIIKPVVIATLGRFAMDYIFRKYGLENILEPISKMHGKSFEVKTHDSSIKLLSLYHPAVCVYNNNMKDILVKDFKKLKKFI